MQRSSRLFEIIQILRAAKQPVRAADLARMLEVSARTVYRDIAALQAMRTPIEGEAGIGYVMRTGYDLPPLNFDRDEIEALRVGLSMLARTGDSALQQAAQRVSAKIEELREPADWLRVAPWGAPEDDPDLGCVSKSMLREAIRSQRKIRLVYRDAEACQTVRIVRPVAMVYHLECVMLAGWCELRHAFRHFRTDRIYGCDLLEQDFRDQGAALQDLWLQANPWPQDSRDLSSETS